MIQLICGAPRTGKSLIAQRLATRSGVASLSTDALRDRVRATLDAEEQLRRFPMQGFSADPAENARTPQELVEQQIAEGRALREAIDAEIGQAVQRGAPLIVEGVHLLPEHVPELVAHLGAERLRAVVVGCIDLERVLRGMELNTAPDDWLRGANPTVHRQVAAFVVEFSQRVRREAAELGLPYLERSDDFGADVEQVLALLV